MPDLFTPNYNPGFAIEWSAADLGMTAVDCKATALTQVTSPTFLDITAGKRFFVSFKNVQTGTPASGVMEIRFDGYAKDGTTLLFQDLIIARLTLSTTASTAYFLIAWGDDGGVAGQVGGAGGATPAPTAATFVGVAGPASLNQDRGFRAAGLVKLKTHVVTASTATASTGTVYFRSCS